MDRHLPPRSLPVATLFGFAFAVGVFICLRWYIESSAAMMGGIPRKSQNLATVVTRINRNASEIINIPLNCSIHTQPRSCPASYYPSENPFHGKGSSGEATAACPDYFQWIYEDLWSWRETGITRKMVKSASRTANFRLVILGGRAYVVTYKKSFQSRDTFTLWGILQLLRRYPGKIPDLDLMFDCVDWPVIKRDVFKPPEYTAPPALFRYCSDNASFDIVFPDWSFWGWPEINIKPWDSLSKEIEEGNNRRKWPEREPYAYWKGNPAVAATRMDLLKCNVSDQFDWNARIYAQDWLKEQRDGFKESDLASQCIHRYKIYIEGSAWSVSEKYILACDSMALLVEPRYHDFFTRSLIPLQHYWPIKDDDKCRSISYAVEWGNQNPQQAQMIGKAGSCMILDELKMDYVYDYMFHLLSEYSKLLKFKPKVPKGAVEVCSESMACHAGGVEKKMMVDSLVTKPSFSNPCTMPPASSPATFHSLVETKNRGMKQVEAWKREYWKSHSKEA